MTKLSKWLGVAAAAAVLATGVLFAGAGSALAQQSPSARFTGTVKVDGAAVPANTLIEAKVGSASCGTARTFTDGGDARFVLDVAADVADKTPGCGADGSTVTFYIGGKMAAETGTWRNYQLNVLNLTYTTPTPTPTAVPTAVPATATAVPPTPKPPSTGQGTGSGGDAGLLGLTVVLLGLGVVAFGLGGVAAARRSRI